MFRPIAALALAAGGAVFGGVQAPPDAQVQAVVTAATNYVENYRKEFSAIVCEEQQVQRLIRPNGSVSKTRTLVSDLMFVKIGDQWMQQPYRDVLSVDGKPVRNRDDRLRKLFGEGQKNAVEQARAIAKESGRYNLGVERVGVSPLLPITLLAPQRVGNFAFTLDGTTLNFREERSPTYLNFSHNGKGGDLPARGAFVVEPGTGAILQATLSAEAVDAPVSTAFIVQYREDPQMKLLVPVEMTERYWQPAKPKAERFEGRVTYGSFRRFQVTVNEKIK